MATEPTGESGPAPAEEAAPDSPAPAPLLALRDGLPEVIETPEGLARACEAIASGTGPVAIDAERASGYRYSPRAYLVQLRREGSGSWLIDPIGFDDLAPLQAAIGSAEWILHAATQDLPCLREIGLDPTSLFDTELAGRLLGHPRVGLASLVESLLGQAMRKEHSAVDWSTRPLDPSWLEYAALDVEVLVELRELLAAELEESGKSEWAAQEFTHLLDFAPAVRAEPWRRTSGGHKVRGRRNIAAVKLLWEARDRVASEQDVSPGRIIPDAAIVAAAGAMPSSRRALMTTPGFHGRGASKYADRWLAALGEARSMEESALPARTVRTEGPPPPRAWNDRDPEAAQRLQLARAALENRAAELHLPVENLLTPDVARRVLWQPPTPGDDLTERVAERLRALSAREWQIDLTAGLLATAILIAADPD